LPQAIFLPQQVGQVLHGIQLLTAQLARADEQLVGYHLLVELLDKAAVQRFVRSPGPGGVGLRGQRLQTLNRFGQDFAQRRRGVEPAGNTKYLGQRVFTQLVGVIQVVEGIMEIVEESFSRDLCHTSPKSDKIGWY